jgi:hypothetical protein
VRDRKYWNGGIVLKRFKIKKANKPEVKQWCLENLGTETVRWWFEEDLIAGTRYSTDHTINFTLAIDVTEEEESRLMFFILKYA